MIFAVSVSYSFSGNRTWNENWRIFPTNISVSQEHLGISHWSAVKVAEDVEVEQLAEV